MTPFNARRACCFAVLICAALPASARASTYTVDDDKADCPNAAFTSLQAAVNQAAPHDTLIVCPGTYLEGSTPTTAAASPAQAGSHNGLTIDKPLTIKGAGASKVLIAPKPAIAVAGSLAGTAPYLRDGGGNVITISRQSLGSTDADENRVDISGVTVASPTIASEAGVAFFNTSGSITNSVVGPLASGYGVVETNSLQGGGTGTVRREVTIAGSLVNGGVLFDDATGIDGAATNNVRSGIIQYGYVEGSRIAGGVTYREGQRGHVTGSEADGIALTDAETGADPTNPAVRGFFATGNALGTLSNAGASASAPGNWVTGAVTGTWETAPALATAPAALAMPPVTADAPPTASFVDPLEGDRIHVGTEIDPVVVANDDFGVKSVAFLVNGKPAATAGTKPYRFDFTPLSADGPLTLTAVVTDSSGQTTTTSLHVTIFNVTSTTGTVGGTVSPTLSLTLGPPASFGAFVPGFDRTYTASTTANVISTAGDATLSVSDPGHLTNGAFALPDPLQVSITPATWSAPVSNAAVAIGFAQHVNANDALRTGAYSRTLTFTLSTTTP